MQTTNYKAVMIFLSTVLLSCSEEFFEPVTNGISATSNNLVKEEYTYGDTGGRFTFYNTCLSFDQQRIGFFCLFGYDSLSTVTVGELSINGEWLWHENLNMMHIGYNKITATEKGYFFYGTDDTNYCLYYLSSESMSSIKIDIPKPAGKDVSGIYHIDYLGNNEYLVYLYARDSYYYAKFSFSANTMQLQSVWIPSGYYLDIGSVTSVNDGYDIVGGRITYSEQGDTARIVTRKIHLSESSATLIYERIPLNIHSSSAVGTYSIYNKRIIVYNGKMYLTIYSEKYPTQSYIMCVNFETGSYIWHKTIKLRPYSLFHYNNRLFITGPLTDNSDFSSSKTDGKYTSYSGNNTYGAINVFDTDGNELALHTFGSGKCFSGIYDASVNNSQIYCFGFTRNIDNYEEDIFISSTNSYRGWFFKVNMDDL